MALADKLQIKPGQRIALLHAPAGVDIGVSEGASDAADAVLVFVTDRAELDERGDVAVEAARRDALAWVAYPKAGQLGTDLSRDVLAELLAAHGIRAVRQISIDEVWSALRFRPAQEAMRRLEPPFGAAPETTRAAPPDGSWMKDRRRPTLPGP